MMPRLLHVLPLICAWVLLSCAQPVIRDVYPILSDGKYDSEFPYRGCSAQLEEIGSTVRMISCIAYYKVFPIEPEAKLRLEDITDLTLSPREKDAVIVNSTASGTATVISSEKRSIAFLTCAHVVSFPETSVTYQHDPRGKTLPWVKTIAFKTKQVNYVAVLSEGGELEVLAIDRASDLAIVGRRFEVEPDFPLPEFKYPLGHARELEWGSFIYLFGYPSGYKMVTKGIVSSPNKDRTGAFLVDAVFTRGFSGGIALGIRDGVPNFELVGIVRAVSARSSYVLVPRPEAEMPDYDPTTPYVGEPYVEKKTEVESGIIQAIPIESVRDFVSSNAERLASKGYYVKRFLREPVERKKGG
jgi:hypothetical protein